MSGHSKTHFSILRETHLPVKMFKSTVLSDSTVHLISSSKTVQHSAQFVDFEHQQALA